MTYARFLLDTNILSEPVKRRPDTRVLALLRQHAHEIVTSAVVLHELEYGAARLAPSSARDLLESYLQHVVRATLDILPYDETAARWHATARAQLESRGRQVPFADGQIAATAAVNGLTLVTRNVRDFSDFPDLHVADWFSRRARP